MLRHIVLSFLPTDGEQKLNDAVETTSNDHVSKRGFSKQELLTCINECVDFLGIDERRYCGNKCVEKLKKIYDNLQ